MHSHVGLLILIMSVTGIFGGLINYLLEIRDNPERASAFRSIVAGTGAAFLVPLFLNMISSDLVAKSSTEPDKLLVFAGFCLIASISSSAFIHTLSDQILNEAKEAKEIAEEIKNEVQPMLAKETEVDLEDIETSVTDNASAIGSVPNKILHALASGKYTWRSISGISHDTELDRAVVQQELSKLLKAGLVNFKDSPRGGKRWSINLLGRMQFIR